VLESKKEVTVKQLAKDIGMSPERLCAQFVAANIDITSVDDLVNEDQKQELLRYLQINHGAKQANDTKKIVLRRTSEIKLTGSGGQKNKTVSIQVRKKHTFVKRPPVDEAAPKETEETTVLSVQPIQPSESLITAAAAPASLAAEALPIDSSVVAAEALPLEAASAPVEESLVSLETKPAEAGVSTDKKTEKDDDKDKSASAAAPKRKEKYRPISETEETESEKFKKKKKSRDATREQDRGFESLLSRGADLSRVLKQEDEDLVNTNRKMGKSGRAAHPRVKIQAFTRPTAPMIREVEVPETISISELAQRMSVKAAEVIKILMKMGVIATINQMIDQDTAILIIEELGHKAKPISFDAIELELEKATAVSGQALPRPPVITIMGHVDHGKTTLLDYIRTAKVAASEAGGITQHIGAYHVQTPKGTITFLDTPGHAAFTAMRARGAKLTDIVILVVAVDDGVMPQTIEAIQHAKAANVPIVVAVNKMDKHGVDPEKIKNEMTQYGLVPEEWGGDAMFVPISAKTGLGVDNLLDSVLVQAEILDLKAVTDCAPRGVVIESRLERGRGAVMSVLVQQGTLRKGDIILAGLEYGRIRALFDETGRQVEEAGPSIPVEVLGLSGIPQAGDDFIIVADEKKAREVAAFRQSKHRETRMAHVAPKLEDFLQRIEDEKVNVTNLNIVLKADVLGSVEALKQALGELSFSEVKVNIISSAIGGINESDVNLAIASKAIIIAFNVRANVEARKLMEANHVDVHYYNIIYDVINQVKKAIQGVLAPEIHERIVGLAQVREVFRSSKIGVVAGCMVTEGFVKRHLPVRVLRDNIVIFEGVLESLRRFKEDVGEVRSGTECGISVKNYHDVKAGDQIEVFEKIEVRREI
jgi:translation initiation factor IF-2